MYYSNTKVNNMRKINKVKIFANENEVSYKIKLKLIEELEKYNFELVDENYDLAIAIGGDGSFLRMVNNTNFNSNIYYVGINTGTLGFLQEIKPDNLEYFMSSLNENNFKVDNIRYSFDGVIISRLKVLRYYKIFSIDPNITIDKSTLLYIICINSMIDKEEVNKIEHSLDKIKLFGGAFK